MTSDDRLRADELSSPDAAVVGARIRVRRKELGLTLQNVADRTALSKSFLSQVEIGKSWPSVNALERISTVLDMPTRAFVADGGDYAPTPSPIALPDTPDDNLIDRRVRITRKSDRKKIVYPGSRGPLDLLTPDLQRRFEVTMANDRPNRWHDVDRTGSEHEEFVLVLEGAYEIQIGDEVHSVTAGDSIYLSPVRGYRFRVVGNTSARAIWIAIPPAF